MKMKKKEKECGQEVDLLLVVTLSPSPPNGAYVNKQGLSKECVVC